MRPRVAVVARVRDRARGHQLALHLCAAAPTVLPPAAPHPDGQGRGGRLPAGCGARGAAEPGDLVR